MPITFRDLKNRTAIIETLNLYSQGIDQRIWPQYFKVFTDDALIDVVGYLEKPLTPRKFQEFLVAKFDETRLSGQHALTNTLFSIEGGSAHTVTEFFAVNLERTANPGQVSRQFAGGLYVDDLVHSNDGWKIKKRIITIKSNEEEILAYPQEIIDVITAAPDAATIRPGFVADPPTTRLEKGTEMALMENELIARTEITDVLVAYAQAQDQEEWDLFDKVFTPDAVLEFPGLGIGPQKPGQFRDFLVNQFNKTRLSGQHALSNTIFAIEGDQARTITEVSYVTLQITDDKGILRRIRGNAIYIDDFIRIDGEWRIRHRVTSQKNIETDDVAYAPELIEAIRATKETHWTQKLERA